MNQRIKLTANMKSAAFIATSASVIAVTAMSFQNMTSADALSASGCSTTSESSYNSSLPASHPSNRCARQSEDLNWANWFTGKSRSNQLHFVDLLELLHGHSDGPLDDVTPANSQQNSL